MPFLINNLLPSCEQLLRAECAAFEKAHGIRRRSALVSASDLDLGEFLQANMHIVIRGQQRALLATHLQWLSMLFLTYLPGIYGRNDSRILLWRQRFRVTYNSPINQLVCGRRYGKTETTSIFVAACLVSLRNEHWILMSASQYCSEVNLSAVKGKVARLLGALGFPKLIAHKDSAEALIFLNYHGLMALRSEGYDVASLPEHVIHETYLSRPTLFSSAAAIAPTDKASRGRKGSVWIDENLYVPDDAQSAVAPLISEGDRVMVLTCSTKENDESRKLEAICTRRVGDGELAINTLIWSKRCAACEELARKNAGSTVVCRHPKPKPSWLAEDVSYVRAFIDIVSMSDNAAAAEMDNESNTNEVPEFAPGDLPPHDSTAWIYPHRSMPLLQWIVISTDPSGGRNGITCSKFVTFFLGVSAAHDVIVSAFSSFFSFPFPFFLFFSFFLFFFLFYFF